jgi:hypothetical protein
MIQACILSNLAAITKWVQKGQKKYYYSHIRGMDHGLEDSRSLLTLLTACDSSLIVLLIVIT